MLFKRAGNAVMGYADMGTGRYGAELMPIKGHPGPDPTRMLSLLGSIYYQGHSLDPASPYIQSDAAALSSR